MTAEHFINESEVDPDSIGTNPALRVVIAYDDLAAGKRAIRVLANLAKGLGDDLEFQPLPWSFDLVADSDWRDVALRDALEADILIIATSDRNPLSPAVEQWVEAAISQKRGTPAAVVALFGPAENPDQSGSFRLGTLQRVAQGAGLDFFAPAADCTLDEVVAGIHLRAETVTSVLENILRQPPSPPRQEGLRLSP